jgi:hypothetical protein
MKTIWKFELPKQGKILMPKGAEILTVQTQNEIPCIWAVVNPDADKEERTFVIYGTGFEFQLIDYKYIGTFQMHSHGLVFHVFEANL